MNNLRIVGIILALLITARHVAIAVSGTTSSRVETCASTYGWPYAGGQTREVEVSVKSDVPVRYLAWHFRLLTGDAEFRWPSTVNANCGSAVFTPTSFAIERGCVVNNQPDWFQFYPFEAGATMTCAPEPLPASGTFQSVLHFCLGPTADSADGGKDTLNGDLSCFDANMNPIDNCTFKSRSITITPD